MKEEVFCLCRLFVCRYVFPKDPARTSANTHQSDNDNHRRHINNHSVSVRTVPRLTSVLSTSAPTVDCTLRLHASKKFPGKSRPFMALYQGTAIIKHHLSAISTVHISSLLLATIFAIFPVSPLSGSQIIQLKTRNDHSTNRWQLVGFEFLGS
ncbi:hypothetical protein ARMGADRAFT_799264 [Armillaria gallica]|uniref:Uncharacterized protein n=1 Tax=Armillaria gallica TaxID=47427 RepID=A0A2H3DJJ8_ARMGA|nr:hypothetical protein ARMGADRAFT_799264 [Armillaria gallica]